MTSIAVVGRAGHQGRGLAYWFALAGHAVVLGSRDGARAEAGAGENSARLLGAAVAVSGSTNAAAVEGADIVLLAVPWDVRRDLVSTLAGGLAGKVSLRYGEAHTVGGSVR